MKKITAQTILLFLLLAACNTKPKNTITLPTGDGDGKVTVDLNQMKNVADNMEKQKNELEKLTPLSIDQLKALVPETLMGNKRTNFQASSAMGAGFASGEYRMNDSTQVKLNIFDCAGTAGAGIYSLQYLGMMNMQQESDNEYTKTVDFNGGKAYEHCDKRNNECTLTYFSGDRFLITLEGDHVGADALKDAAKGLSIK